MTNGIYTILLLIMSNVFMTFAWYGHLRLQQSGISSNWPLYLVIAFSWMIAFFEYCCQVPANRIGFIDNGGPFNLVQLKVIQECISLVVFAVIANCSHCELHLPARAAALEPRSSRPLSRCRCLLRLYEALEKNKPPPIGEGLSLLLRILSVVTIELHLLHLG